MALHLQHVAVLVLGALAAGVSAQQFSATCQFTPPQTVTQAQFASGANDTALGITVTRSVAPGSCDAWQIPADVLAAQCPSSTSWLLVELYRLSSGSGLDTADASGVYLMAARGNAPPTVTAYLNQNSFTPGLNTGVFLTTPSASDPGGNDGTFFDVNGRTYLRSYHRVLVPNVTQNVGNSPWYLTVANLPQQPSDPLNRALTGYGLRLTCVDPAAVPCPRALLATGPCGNPSGSNAGQCVTVTSGDPRSQVCKCVSGYGDYGCQRPMQGFASSGTAQDITVPLGQWAHFKVQAPPLQSLVVEFIRSPALSAAGADPILIVKPANTNDRNVPTYPDFPQYGDWNSWRLQQRLHYRVVRSFQAASSGVGEFYVSVLNNAVLSPSKGGQGFTYGPGRGAQPERLLVGTIRARWLTTGSAFVCPVDCSNQGSCIDPLSPGGSQLVPAYVPVDYKQGFFCSCRNGTAGLLCESKALRVPLTQYGVQVQGSVRPGEWDLVTFVLDGRNFNVRTDDLLIQWLVGDMMSSPASVITNALMTFDAGQYPRQADPANPNPYQAGQMTTYPTYVSSNNQGLTYQGSTLSAGQTYVVGIYNSDYTRSMPFSYIVSVGTPSPNSPWLKPYMSIVLGISAALVLCLAMTLCKRLLATRQWNNRGRAGWDMDMPMGGTGGRHAVVQIVQRHPGVPPTVIERFPTYEYVKSADATGVAKKADPLLVSDEPGQLGVATLQADTDRPTNNTRPGVATRAEREALQVVAAEAATQAAAAVRAAAEQKLQAPAADGDGGADAATAAGGGGGPAAAPGGGEPAARANPGADGAAAPAGDSPVLTAEDADAMAAAAAQAAAAAHLQHQHQGVGGGLGKGEGGMGEHECGDEGPSCTVCLCEYEDGDMMRRLPCGHEFHRACIDKWMTQHTTCPMCREALVSPEDLTAAQQNGQGNRVAVIYIPQTVSPQRASPGPDGQPPNSTPTQPPPPQTLRDRVRSFFSPPSRRAAPAGGARGASDQELAAGGMPGGANGGGPWQSQPMGPPGWHVTMAWGSTNPGGDPFASPLPMVSRPRHSSSMRRANNSGTARGAGPAPGAVAESRPVASASASLASSPSAGGAGGGNGGQNTPSRSNRVGPLPAVF